LLDLAGIHLKGDHEPAAEADALERSARRAKLVVAVDALALAGLFVVRDRSRPFLDVGPYEETVVTLAVLAIAAHLGFRLAQLLLYRSVARQMEELPDD
jgi:hypothetical protein